VRGLGKLTAVTYAPDLTCHGNFRSKNPKLKLDFLRMQFVIGVKKRNHISRGSVQANISRRGQTQIALIPDVNNLRIALQNGFNTVCLGRAVIDHDDLFDPACLPMKRSKSEAQGCSIPVTGDDYADSVWNWTHGKMLRARK
jgi:hypothetical protein